MSEAPVAAVGAVFLSAEPAPVQMEQTPTASSEVSFFKLLSDGIEHVNEQLVQSDALVQSFVLDDSIPPHQVMFALEKAQLSLQLMLQVRNRLVEGYQEIMRMQL